MRLSTFVLVLWFASLALPGFSQRKVDTNYSRANTYAAFVEYSNDSSHMLLGTALDRRIGAVGLQYERRLVRGSMLNFSYMASFRPAMLESDPVAVYSTAVTSPTAGISVGPTVPVSRCSDAQSSFSYTLPDGTVYSGTTTIRCDRRTVFAQGLSPIGFRLNGMTRHRLQPTLTADVGYLFATQPIPVDEAGSFNFTFEFGAGLELYRSATRSIRAEYLVQHYSNKYTAVLNPGVDSGFVKLTYGFGR